MKKPLIAMVMLLLGVSSFAQVDTLSFTLKEAMDYATENAYQSKSSDYDIQAAEKKVWEYIATGLPQVSVEGQLNDNLSIQETVFKMPDENGNIVEQSFKMGQKYNWNATGRISQLLFDGSYLLGVKASRIYVEISEKNKLKTEIDVRQTVAEAYYTALVAQKNLEAFKINQEVNEKTLQETQAYYDNGFRELTDVDQLKLMVNQSRNLVLEAERQMIIADAVLKYAMGMDIGQPIQLSDNIDFLLTPVEAYTPQSGGFDFKSHINYTILMTQEDVQKTLIKNEKVQYLPKLNAFYNYSYIEYGDKFSDMLNTNSEVLGLSLSWSLFKSGSQSARVQQEKINYLKLQNQMRQMEQGLKQQLLVAESNFKNARASYLNDKEGEEIAHRIYDRTRIKFTNGMATSVELSQNEGQYIDAQLSFIQSTLNLLDTHIKYLKATNQL